MARQVTLKKVPDSQVPGIFILGSKFRVRYLSMSSCSTSKETQVHPHFKPHPHLGAGLQDSGLAALRMLKGRGEKEPEASSYRRVCVRESMATLRRLREVPRHLLVCEKSNFRHDKSRHRHLVETHYHNYRVSPTALSPRPKRLREIHTAWRDEPAFGTGGAGVLARCAGSCSLLTAPSWLLGAPQDYNSQGAPGAGRYLVPGEGAGQCAPGGI